MGWFGAFQLCEDIDICKGDLQLSRTLKVINRATAYISRELLWKVHLEAAQILERVGYLFAAKNDEISSKNQFKLAQQSLTKAVLTCPENLRWKVWLAAGRMEFSAGNSKTARQLLLKAYDVAPLKGQSTIFLECARLEEFIGNIDLSRSILCKARNEVGADWKVWLESVSLEMRNNFRGRAIHFAQSALKIHPCTGRLWAAFVQLRQPDGEEMQMHALRYALQAVPKSGEVWCEAARLFLNPFSSVFDLDEAAQQLDFATKFTPQYGDSFLETLRLELLQKWIVPMSGNLIDNMTTSLKEVNLQPGENNVSCFYRVLSKSVREIFLIPKKQKHQNNAKSSLSSITANLNMNFLESIDIDMLQLRCCNAAPNYGKLWFNCHHGSTDTAYAVLNCAKKKIGKDLLNYAYLYLSALVRKAGIEWILENHPELLPTKDRGKSLQYHSLSAPTLSHIIQIDNDKISDQSLLLESGISGMKFVTGLVEINCQNALESLSLIERRKVLFGSDLSVSRKPE